MSLQKSKAEIEAIDLRAYSEKAVKEKRLRRDEVEQAENEYRHFLQLVYLNQELQESGSLAPTALADEIWHGHILDTRNYRTMCDRLFGQYIDHNPGMEEGSKELKEAVEHTAKIDAHLDRCFGFIPGAIFDGSPADSRKLACSASCRSCSSTNSRCASGCGS